MQAWLTQTRRQPLRSQMPDRTTVCSGHISFISTLHTQQHFAHIDFGNTGRAAAYPQAVQMVHVLMLQAVLVVVPRLAVAARQLPVAVRWGLQQGGYVLRRRQHGQPHAGIAHLVPGTHPIAW